MQGVSDSEFKRTHASSSNPSLGLCQRDDDDFLNWNITEIKLHNFMTFSDLKCKPAPNMDLKFRKNSSSKISLVCAIALALGSEPQDLEEATSIGAYVKSGQASGYVEITLRGETADEQINVMRKIDTCNKSEWLLNGKVVDKKEIVELTQRLNIQVKMLTQVHEKTEKAVGDSHLTVQHHGLVTKSEELKKSEQSAENKKGTLDELKALNIEKERDVECVCQTEKQVVKVENIKAKLACPNHDFKKAENLGFQEQEKEIMEKVEVPQKCLKELEESIQKQKQTEPNNCVQLLVEKNHSDALISSQRLEFEENAREIRSKELQNSISRLNGMENSNNELKAVENSGNGSVLHEEEIVNETQLVKKQQQGMETCTNQRKMNLQPMDIEDDVEEAITAELSGGAEGLKMKQLDSAETVKIRDLEENLEHQETFDVQASQHHQYAQVQMNDTGNDETQQTKNIALEESSIDAINQIGLEMETMNIESDNSDKKKSVLAGPSNEANAKGGLAKARLCEICTMKHWRQPLFECCKEEGPDHSKLYTFKVSVEIREGSTFTNLECNGETKSSKKAAVESAAEGALWYLKQAGYWGNSK